MSLTILCATRAEEIVWPFLREQSAHAAQLDADYVLVANDYPAIRRIYVAAIPNKMAVDAATGGGIHHTMETVVSRYIHSDYVFILDDDERCTSRLVDWLAQAAYTTADFWSIPRAWLYRDVHHHICSRKHWPNPATRIGRRELVSIPTTPMHAGWLAGPGTHDIAPFAIEHHKLLIRSLADREAEVAERDALIPGAGMFKQYLPEKLHVDIAPWEG